MEPTGGPRVIGKKTLCAAATDQASGDPSKERTTETIAPTKVLMTHYRSRSCRPLAVISDQAGGSEPYSTTSRCRRCTQPLTVKIRD